MARFDAVLPPPPPSLADVEQNTLPVESGGKSKYNGGDATTSSTSAENLSPSIIITVLILATAVIVSASLYLLLRFLSSHFSRRHASQIDAFDNLHHQHHNNNVRQHRHNSSRRVSPEENSLIDSLPLFTFDSITGRNSSTNTGDCAVCLSKFEPHDQLRLLPVCCHVFHAPCIDTWLATNQTCPLCRSPIFLSEWEVMNKIRMMPSSGHRSGSFRIEIGNVSSGRLPSNTGERRRSYSIGSFDYIVDDLLTEVTVASTRRGSDYTSGDKSDAAHHETELATEVLPGQSIVAEIAGSGRSWLKDYVDRLALATSFSLSSSFRNSGRIFTGSSRRTEINGTRDSDLEASRLGDDIGEMFRWLSGV
ncbi:hypothetical protein Nepgr_002495 [Nepenthes gracilis]|uniref:RING-type domain-containing protein n=1 Tax=Nepenthes gracilis TaxID=150966 RepID=A0AAD3P6D1_NEPGR|nr:hypothetical protein Nepgr_002495 [Nepenthes gracilis]